MFLLQKTIKAGGGVGDSLDKLSLMKTKEQEEEFDRLFLPALEVFACSCK